MARPRFASPGRRRLLQALAGAVSALLTDAVATANEPVVVIVNKDNLANVDLAFVRRVYLGSEKGWPDGSPVFALDLPEDSDVRQAFCVGILGKSVANVRAIWSQNIFTGRGLPPKLTPADAEMKRIVAQNRNAIGYIRASQVDASVRVLSP